MRHFDWIYRHALNRKGGVEILESMLPVPRSPPEINQLKDSYLLSSMSWRIFCAGLNRKMINAKWPFFEQVFWGFDPQKLILMGDERLEMIMRDRRLIRHWGKIKSIRANAGMILALGEKTGGFGRFIADWPAHRIIDLFQLLAKEGAYLGGNSAAYFLRIIGKDTFVLNKDVVVALKAQNIIDKKPTNRADFEKVQEAFNCWQAQSQRPLCQISRLLSFCANE